MGAYDLDHPTWHSAKEGDILHTKGKVTCKRYDKNAWGGFSRRSVVPESNKYSMLKTGSFLGVSLHIHDQI
jgi:hypothetical protein